MLVYHMCQVWRKGKLKNENGKLKICQLSAKLDKKLSNAIIEAEVIPMKTSALPVLCGAYPYCYAALFLALQFYDFQTPGLPFPILLGILALGPVLGIVGAAAGWKAAPEQAAAWGLRVKLAHIPFYVLVCFLTLFLPLGIVFFFIIDVLTLISGTGFGIAAILRARKEGRVTTGWAVLHILLHCCFILDVISAFLIRKKLR